jgi:hypothetical protein
MARSAVLCLAVLFVAGLGYLTVSHATERGVDALTVTSIILFLVLGLGVLGALTSPPNE